jgi:precorrin-2/cobalt-factor-2 C20-methyltransferase
MTVTPGILYGIGVGPGDPELITLKALHILERVPQVFAAASTKNDYSLALNIVRHYIAQAEVEPLYFPMTSDRQVLAGAWEANAEKVLKVLQRGLDAAFLTIGDPLTYSTYGYLLRTVKNIDPDIKAITIPGITSYNAAAALANIPLTEGEESFYLVSGARGGDRLREAIATSDNVVMLKTYRHFDKIYETLEELQLLDCATCISMCGLSGETVAHDLRPLKNHKMPYLSLIIIKKKGRGF